MAKVDDTTKRFWNKAIVSFLKYYPVRIKNVGLEQEAARKIVWDFKDGKSHEEVAQMTAKHLKDMFGDKVKDIVFSCVPASSAEKNELRYKVGRHMVANWNNLEPISWVVSFLARQLIR